MSCSSVGLLSVLEQAGLSRRGRADVRYSSPVRSATYLEKPDSKESYQSGKLTGQVCPSSRTHLGDSGGAL
ncbi:hypothetical protein, partial [Photobacterium damselae]|uniref:hypothetical protein n=1 Tax=Photobacterium damselae TaxID=38293 RepID=UPI0040686142